jgi:hypothetical protein
LLPSILRVASRTAQYPRYTAVAELHVSNW